MGRLLETSTPKENRPKMALGVPGVVRGIATGRVVVEIGGWRPDMELEKSVAAMLKIIHNHCYPPSNNHGRAKWPTNTGLST